MAQLGHAKNGEFRKGRGTQLGNQYKLLGPEAGYTYDEVAITEWCNLNAEGRPLIAVFRFKDAKYRRKMVKAITNACNNPNVGYDNDYRTTYRKEVGKLPGGFTISNLARVNTPCACDCSSLVALCFYCVTGKDPGNFYTGTEISALKNTGLVDVMTEFSDETIETGQGLIPGDITLWYGALGHTAVVVSTSNSTVPDANTYGLKNIVIADEENGKDAKLYGQNKICSVENTSGPLRLNYEGKEILKVVATTDDAKPKIIYGFTDIAFVYSMVGDSRTVQLGFDTLPKANKDYGKQYGLVQDKNIFAIWGARLADKIVRTVDDQNNVSYYFSSDIIAKKVKSAAETQNECVNFWIGINDVQAYKDYFIGNEQDQFIGLWVDCYKDMVDKYKEWFGVFDEYANRIYITSIVSTSTNEKDYYPEQGNVIKKINAALKAWVDEVQEDFVNQWEDKQVDSTTVDAVEKQVSEKDCWLQYVELNVDKNGNVIDPQDFVKDSDFVDDIHFTKDWFTYKFMPKYNFQRLVGDPQMGDLDSDYSQDFIWSNALKIYNYLTSLKYSRAFISGILANMNWASNMNIQAKSNKTIISGMPEADYTAFGLMAWQNTSYSDDEQQGAGKDMMDYCDSHGGVWYDNLQGQVDFLLSNLFQTQGLNNIKNVAETSSGAALVAKKVSEYYRGKSSKEDFDAVGRYADAFYRALDESIDQQNRIKVFRTVTMVAQSKGTILNYSGATLTQGTLKIMPTDVFQAGIVPNYEPYYRMNFSYLQGDIKSLWLAQPTGQQSMNNIATLKVGDSYYYLIAMANYFATTGNIVTVILENGQWFNAILGDAKSQGDPNYTPYGHKLGYSMEKGVDVVEWCLPSAGVTQNDLKNSLIQLGWYGQKVKEVINYGPFFNGHERTQIGEWWYVRKD